MLRILTALSILACLAALVGCSKPAEEPVPTPAPVSADAPPAQAPSTPLNTQMPGKPPR